MYFEVRFVNIKNKVFYIVHIESLRIVSENMLCFQLFTKNNEVQILVTIAELNFDESPFSDFDDTESFVR